MASSTNSREVTIRGDHIELAQLLKFGGLVGTGGEAKQVIGAGQVSLNDTVETQRGKKVVAGDRVSCNGQTLLVRRA